MVLTMILSLGLLILILNQCSAKSSQADEMILEEGTEGMIYVIEATDAYVIRKPLGEITEEVRGVPAIPVHSFTWDGSGVQAVDGRAYAELDPNNNSGKIHICWTDEHGDWVIEQTDFTDAPMPMGLRFGSSIEETQEVSQDSITPHAYLHGDTGSIDPALPTLFSYILTWGKTSVTLNGEMFENPFDGPAPQWLIHTMLITGVYDENGLVHSETDEYYNPHNPGEGITQYDDLEFQFIFMDAPSEEHNESFPPMFDFAYHMTFEDVKVRIEHRGR